MTDSLEYRMRKRTLAPGWCEVTIVVKRDDTPDCDVVGDVAKERFAMFVLAAASDIAARMGLTQVEALMGDMGAHVLLTFEAERLARAGEKG